MPANRVVIPLVIILAILHVGIIGLILSINTQTGELSQTMQKSSAYIEEATSLLAGSSLLSETASNFVLVPTTQDGEVNIHPLVAYANELSVDRWGDRIVERFRNYQVSDEVMEPLTRAAESADNMMEAQLHALALMTSIYPLPDVPPLGDIPIPALTPEEQRRRGISISWGSAYAEDISQTTFKALMDQADKEMYGRKEKMHAEDPVYAQSHNLA